MGNEGKIGAVAKFLDVIQSAVGRMSKSYFTKKDYNAEAYGRFKLAETDLDILEMIQKRNKPGLGLKGVNIEDGKLRLNALPISTINNLPNDSLEIRANNRILTRELKRQLNIEAITAIAAEQLKDDPEVVDEPLNETWVNRFFNIAEDVTEEELQNLWGRILAGEIKRPKSYSLRTLDVIRTLDKSEANIITKIAKFSFESSGLTGILNDPRALIDIGVDWINEITILREIGVLHPDGLNKMHFSNFSKTEIFFIDSGNKVLKIIKTGEVKYPDIPYVPYTKIGKEILSLIDYEPHIENLKLIANRIKNGNVNAKVYISTKVKNNETGSFLYVGNDEI